MAVQFYEEEMEQYWQYIAERHRIYHKKEILKLPPPWTDNQHLANYKFTNVFRELDRGSKYVIQKVCLNEDLSFRDKVFNILIYRIFTKIETFEKLGITKLGEYDAEYFEQVLKEIYHSDEKIFTNAFVVSGYSQFGSGMPKYERVCILFKEMEEQLLKNSLVEQICEAEDMEEAYKCVKMIDGFGPFLGYQVCVDFTYCPECLYDENKFTVMGPGARRGIEHLFTEEMVREHGHEWLCFWLRDNQISFFEDYKIDYKEIFKDRGMPPLTVMALENCCCEFSKYNKLLNNHGRPRNTYSPKDGYERFKTDGYMEW